MDELLVRYPVVNIRTGIKIYQEMNVFCYSSYHQLIKREIINSNLMGVYGLCCALSTFDRAFAWYDYLMETAIQEETTVEMFALVFYMWNFHYEDRDSTMTIDTLREKAGGRIDDAKMRIIDVAIKIAGEACVKNMNIEEDDQYEQALETLKTALSQELTKLGVNLEILNRTFDDNIVPGG